MSLRLAFRLQPVCPSLVRTLVNRSVARPPPPQRGSIKTPEAFLQAIGRSSETKLSIGVWDEFWRTNGVEMKKAGLGVRDRRYIMWCMEKYRLGQDPAEFAHPAQPAKKIRGRGPAVQNGKRLRSRRR